MGKVRVENQTEPTTPTTGHTDIYVDSTTKKLTTKDDLGNVINYGLLSEGIIELATTINSNVLLTGCDITINVSDNTKIDITSGTGILADSHTDPDIPDVSKLTIAAKTGVTNTNIANSGGSFVWIDSGDNVVFTNPLDGSDGTNLRDYIFIGVVLHPDRTTHSGVNNANTGTPIEISASLTDLSYAVGQINVEESGNIYSAAGAALQVFKSAGKVHFFGQNYKNDRKNPNVLTIGEFSPATMTYTYQDGLGGFNTTPTTTNVNPGRYDDGTGGAVPLPNGTVGATEWTVQKLYMNPAVTIVHYGQSVYNSKAEAIASIGAEQLEKNPELATVPLRAYLVVRGNATNLSDLSQAEFFCADKFGIDNICGGPENNTDIFQSVYDNTAGSAAKLNSTNGPVTFQDADTPISDDFLDLRRSGGTESAFKVDTERMVSPAPASAPADGDLDTSTVTLYQDETNDYLRAKVKQSDDSVHSFILSAGQPDSYGEMYEQGLASVITVSTAGTYYGWTTASSGLVAGTGLVTFTDNSTADRLTVGVDGGGIYRVDCFVSFSGSNSAVIEGAIYKTGSREDKISFTRKLGVGGDVGTAACSGLLSLSSGDYIDLRFTSDSNGDTLTIANLNVSITRV